MAMRPLLPRLPNVGMQVFLWMRVLSADYQSVAFKVCQRAVELVVVFLSFEFELFSQLIDTLGDRGRVSCVGRLAGPVPDFNTASLFFRRIGIGGVAVGAYTPDESRRV